MNITIQGNKHKVKPSALMTVEEYIKFFGLIKKGINDLRAILLYLHVIFDIDFNKVLTIKIDSKSLMRISAYIGLIKSIDQIAAENKNVFIYNNTGKLYERLKINYRTVGVRLMLQERKTDNELELMVYLLAILIGGTNDSEKVEEVYNNLLNHNAIEVFSFTSFFFVNLQSGLSLGTRFMQLIKRQLGISTLAL